ncbi:MAG: carboxypeptidase-like regulatory domain-containing protein, partial [Bacteroides sp.]|nr:carboxypeptidase-like regulatory domain-containing protein [Bacteroides sp.]
MKIKNLTQKGKYVLVASILGMTTTSLFAAPAELGGGYTELAVTQQIAKIKGTILDAKNGEPIIGANVLVKGTTNGTITDFDGNYELEAPVGSTLTVSFIGYKTIEVKATAEKQTIRLTEDTETLDEVVVVGYTSQRKESLTGAMTTVKSDKLKDVTTPSVENML